MYILSTQFNYEKYDEEFIQKELDKLDSKYKFTLYCTARGIDGRVFATRKFKGNPKQYEYLIFNRKNMRYEWINNNGYCKFGIIENKIDCELKRRDIYER